MPARDGPPDQRPRPAPAFGATPGRRGGGRIPYREFATCPNSRRASLTSRASRSRSRPHRRSRTACRTLCLSAHRSRRSRSDGPVLRQSLRRLRHDMTHQCGPPAPIRADSRPLGISPAGRRPRPVPSRSAVPFCQSVRRGDRRGDPAGRRRRSCVPKDRVSRNSLQARNISAWYFWRSTTGMTFKATASTVDARPRRTPTTTSPAAERQGPPR